MAEEIGRLFARIGADVSGLEKGLQKSVDMMTRTGQKMSQVGGQMSKFVTLPLLAMGAVAAKSFMDLDKEMRNIQSISKQSDDSLLGLQQRFIDISADMTMTTDSASALAAGFYDIQSSGFAGDDALEILLRSTKAASAGLASTAIASKAMTAKLNAYGQGAEYASITSDLMFRTVDRGVLTFSELSGSIGDVVGMAANAGVGFDVVSAALATMTKQGLGADEASTSLNQLLVQLVKPTAALSDALGELGFESGMAALDTLGLQGTLELLTDSGFDSSESLASIFSNIRSLRGVLALTGKGAKIFADDLEAMGNAAGATEAAFEIQTRSLSAQLANLKNNVMAVGLELISVLVPSFQTAVTWVGGLVKQFRGLDDEQQKNIVKWGLIALAAGPALKILGGGIMIVGGLARGFLGLLPLVTAIPVFLGDIAAGIALIGGGEGFFAVAASGAAGFLAALLPIVAAISAIAVPLLLINKAYKETEVNAAAAHTAYSEMFDEMVAGGASATQIVTQYGIAQAKANKEIEDAPFLIKHFASNLNKLKDMQAPVNKALIESSETYVEYKNAMESIGQSHNILIEATWEHINAVTKEQRALQGTTEVVDEVASAYDEYKLAIEGLDLGIEAMTSEQWEAVYGTEELEAALASLGIEIEGQEKELSAVEQILRQYEVAQLDAAAAAQELGLRQLDLNMSLKGANKTQLAQAAIGQLSQAYSDGKLSFDDYTTAVGNVQDTFGLVNDRSVALSTGLLGINEALKGGYLPAENYQEALAAVYEDAKDGDIDLRKIIEDFGNLPAEMDNAISTALEAEDALGAIGDISVETAEKIGKAYEDEDWAGVGSAISEGIVQGIESGVEQIEAAAAAAALAALAAAMAALGIVSPSKAFAGVGKSAMEGMALGIENYSSHAEEAAHTAATDVIGAGFAGARSGSPGGDYYERDTAEGGDTYIDMAFYDEGAAALGLAYVHQQRYDRLSSRM